MSQLARSGPIKTQSDGVMSVLRSPQSAVHLVTLLEDMPVQETADAIGELEKANLPVGSVIVNMATEPLLPQSSLDRAAEGRLTAGELASALAAAGLTDAALAEALAEEAVDHARTWAAQDALRGTIAELGRPTVELPQLVGPIDLGCLFELAGRCYQSLSSSFAGTQEYMAMEKLGQLRASERWDLIIVDTPPSRSALDFLDAPNRMSRFLDGTMIRLLTAPARAGGRAGFKLVGAGFMVFSRIISKMLGGQLLQDISAFVSALDTMIGGFRERATATYELLRRPGTWFVVVATPEADALREASYFVDRLSAEGMPLAGLVVNRTHPPATTALSATRAEAAAEAVAEAGGKGAKLAAGALRVHAERMLLAIREQRLADRFTSAHPEVPVRTVPAAAGDVHDLGGLRVMAEELTGPDDDTPTGTPR